MDNLFDVERHEPLTDRLWCPDLVQTEIKAIIDDIEKAMLPEGYWPTHPLDAESYPTAGPKWSAYAGAAGTIHGLKILSSYGYKAPDLSLLLPSIYHSFLENPDVSVEPGLQIGEMGILLPAFLRQPENGIIKERLIRCMTETINLPLYEITSGQSGMMHAALALYRQTEEKCWKDLYVSGAESLMNNWQQDPYTGEWLWKSEVFGFTRHYYGACHGIAGNANIILQGADLLSVDCTQTVIDRAVSTLNISARKMANMTNWTLCTKPDIEKLLIQWCHGAAGVVTAMAKTPINDSSNSMLLDELLENSGELIWYAGPLNKGSGICHGTSGNGYAFLYLYQRTGHLSWLDRARKFAIHAIEQCQRDRLSYDQGRYTLWTGDAGLAIYLHHCLSPKEAAIPGLDLF